MPDCRGAALMRALCAGVFRRPRRGRRAARTRPRVVRCGGREAHPRKARPQMSAAAGSPRKALCSVSAPLQPAPPHSSAGGRTRRGWSTRLAARGRGGGRGAYIWRVRLPLSDWACALSGCCCQLMRVLVSLPLLQQPRFRSPRPSLTFAHVQSAHPKKTGASTPTIRPQRQ